MTDETLDPKDPEQTANNDSSESSDLKFLEMKTKSQPIDFAKLPKAVRVNLDDLATSIFDPRGGRALVIGYAVTGKTFFIEQFIGHVDRYLEKIPQDKLIFVKLTADNAAQIETLPGGYRSYVESLVAITGLREEEICFVTESFDIASALSVYGGNCKIIFELSIFTFDQIRRMESSGKSKNWLSWAKIDANFIHCTKDEIATLIYESLSSDLEKSYNVKILKKDILIFINYCLKNIPELILDPADKLIVVPPGIWAMAITRLAGALAFSSDTDLSNKTGNKVFARVVAKIYNESCDEFSEYLSLNDEDEFAGLSPEMLEGMGMHIIQSAGIAPSGSAESAKTAPSATASVFSDFDTLTERLEEEVIGQPEAVESVVEGLLVPAAGLNDAAKPVRSMMFLGPTGVGKTKLALTLAAELMIDPLHVVRLDMSEYSQPNEAVKLFGAPPGYVGHGQGGALTTPVEKNPHSLILLDEVEKAHPLIWDTFLQVLDAGVMTTGAGKQIDFSKTVIVMTSNLGSRELARKSAGFLIGNNHAVSSKSDAEISSTILKEVEQFFKPELINRIDDLIIFKDLSLDTTRKIVAKEIELVAHRANLAGYTLEKPGDDIIEAILQKTDVSKYGARQIQRTVLKYISNPIARSMLKKIGSSMELTFAINDKDEISVLEK